MAFEWKPLLRTVAPWMGTALGGPLGGAAVTAIGGALGLDKPTERKIGSLLTAATSEQLLALQLADVKFQEVLQKAGFENIEKLEAIAAQDRDSARRREIAVRDATTRNLAYAVTVALFGLLAFMLFGKVPKESAPILNVLVGSLGAAWGSIMNYYYGSSAGSDKKTDLMAQQAQGGRNGQ